MASDELNLDQALRSCESELLHLSGQIQPCGILLAVRDADDIVTHVSRNAAPLLDVPPESILGQPVPAALIWSPLSEIRAAAVPGGLPILFTNAATIEGKQWDLVVSRTGEGCLFEFEPSGPPPPCVTPWMHETLRLIRTPTGPGQPDTNFRRLAEIVSHLTGFGRVLLYRFDDDWSGEVVAEVLDLPLDSYLGLRFPASDIPANARALYARTRQRFISDTETAPIDVIGLDPTAPPLDQGSGMLRSVSPLHLQYLRNMKIRSSFSAPVIVKGKLWGMIACHHPAPISLPPAVRDQVVRVARDFAIGYLAFVAGEHLRFVDGIDRAIVALLGPLGPAAPGNTIERLRARTPDFLRLVAADSAAIMVGDRIELIGDSPTAADITEIDRWFLTAHPRGFVSTACLSSLFPPAAAMQARASGMIALRVPLRQGLNADLRVFWFRRELPRLVRWAGNPVKTAANDGAGPLTPRHSFDVWTETALGRSKSWSLADLLAAKTFRATVFRQKGMPWA
ncbi:GAF domain-containing protein [Magnetospirillum molischianum]|uniref:Putative Bacteriophytochrome n=1 Tax=Magnetospirillum molischianum DSM 120 TaxID=1150626 RepID=H8FVX0_MAGML|nr:GAF domain-containing protein [Magnetospirillum molischianum]CCG42508.1 putative Bacteriophytochrome [Magnetospirillum molischianum DSM 120]